MKTRQVLIEINEELYNAIMNQPMGVCSEMEKRIQQGTLLPEGHGRLIDADVIKEKMGNLDGFGLIGRCVDEIPTVLESDK